MARIRVAINFAGVMAVIALAALGSAQGYSFKVIKQVGAPIALARDGSVFVTTDNATSFYCLWSFRQGWIPDYMYPTLGISANGLEATGEGGRGVPTPAYWTQATGEVLLPRPPGLGQSDQAWASTVSEYNGIYLINTRAWDTNYPIHAFELSGSTYTDLGVLDPKSNQTVATAMSLDGRVVAGASLTNDLSSWRAFRWTKQTGMVDIGAESNGYSGAYEPMSGDGSVIFGVAPADDVTNYDHGYRWTQSGGREAFGTFSPTSCTVDGNVAVGYDYYIAKDGIWIKGVGEVDLAAYLASHGVSTQGSTLSSYNTVFISGDGTVIVGSAEPYAYVITTPGFFVAIPDSYTINGNATFNEPAPGVLGNDTNTNAGVATLVGAPSHSTAFKLNADGSFSYTPVNGFIGTDSFTYEITKNGFSSNVTTATITVVTPPKLATFTLSTGNVYMCSEFTGTATLDKPTASPIYVNVVSSDPSVVSVASNPYIPAGGTSTTIYFYSHQLNTFDYQRPTITASCGGVSIARQINVFPIPLKSFTVGANTLHSGQSTTGTVTVNLAPSKLPIVVAISNSSAALTVPSTATIPPGSASASFTIAANTVTKPTVVHLSAAVSGTVQSQTITVDP